MVCGTDAPVVGIEAVRVVTPTSEPEVYASVTTPFRSLTALVLSSVMPSTGAWTAKFTVMPGTGTPRESVRRYEIDPRSWMPDPLRPTTNGPEAVTAMLVAGPGGVPGGGVVPPPPPGGGVVPPPPPAATF